MSSAAVPNLGYVRNQNGYAKREKVTNIEYRNVDFENDIIEFLTSTPI